MFQEAGDALFRIILSNSLTDHMPLHVFV